MTYDTSHIDELEYFKNPDEIVPVGDLLGDSSLNLTKTEFKKLLKEVLEEWGDVLDKIKD